MLNRFRGSTCPATCGATGWGLSPWAHTHRRYNEPRSLGELAEIDDTMRTMERTFNQLNRWMDSAWRDFGRDFGQEVGWDPMETLATDVMRPEIYEDQSGNKKYRLNIHLGDNFPPENIKVGLKDRVMTIQAKMEQKADDGNARVYREVSRQFTLPPNLDLKEVKSIMEPNGILKVEAPMPQEALPEPPTATEIPIHLE